MILRPRESTIDRALAEKSHDSFEKDDNEREKVKPLQS